MALNLLSIIKTLSQSKAVADTVSSLIKQYKGIKKEDININEVKKFLEIQSSLNEQLEKQINILQSSVEKIQKSVFNLTIIAAAAAILSIIAILIYLI